MIVECMNFIQVLQMQYFNLREYVTAGAWIFKEVMETIVGMTKGWELLCAQPFSLFFFFPFFYFFF